MKVLMIQERSPDELFTVYGPQGEALYMVCGQYMGLHGVFGLMDQNGREKASIRRFGSDCLGYYRVSLAGGREFSLMKRFIVARSALHRYPQFRCGGPERSGADDPRFYCA